MDLRKSYFVIEKTGVFTLNCEQSDDSILWNVVCASAHIWLQKNLCALTNGIKGSKIYSVWLMVVLCCGLQFELVNGAVISLSETKYE